MADFPIPLTTVAFGAITGSFADLIDIAGRPDWVGIENLVIENATDADIEVSFNDGTTANAVIESGTGREWQIFINGTVVNVRYPGSAGTSGEVRVEGFK